MDEIAYLNFLLRFIDLNNHDNQSFQLKKIEAKLKFIDKLKLHNNDLILINKVEESFHFYHFSINECNIELLKKEISGINWENKKSDFIQLIENESFEAFICVVDSDIHRIIIYKNKKSKINQNNIKIIQGKLDSDNDKLQIFNINTISCISVGSSNILRRKNLSLYLEKIQIPIDEEKFDLFKYSRIRIQDIDIENKKFEIITVKHIPYDENTNILLVASENSIFPFKCMFKSEKIKYHYLKNSKIDVDEGETINDLLLKYDIKNNNYSFCVISNNNTFNHFEILKITNIPIKKSNHIYNSDSDDNSNDSSDDINSEEDYENEENIDENMGKNIVDITDIAKIGTHKNNKFAMNDFINNNNLKCSDIYNNNNYKENSEKEKDIYEDHYELKFVKQDNSSHKIKEILIKNKNNTILKLQNGKEIILNHLNDDIYKEITYNYNKLEYNVVYHVENDNENNGKSYIYAISHKYDYGINTN